MSSLAPKITVVVTVYNDEAHLQETLDSVAAQTLPGLEVVCVDDGSTDRSPLILAEMAAGDARFRVITRPNGGPSAARHSGQLAATGEYLYILDSDDLLEVGVLERVVRAMDAGSLDVLRVETRAFPDSAELTEPANTENVMWARQPAVEGVVTGLELVRAMLDSRCFQVMTWLYVARRQYLLDERIVWPPTQTTEDQGFTQRELLFAERAGFLPGPIHRRRVRKGSYSRSGESAVYLQQRIVTAIETAEIFEEWELATRRAYAPRLLEVARRTGVELVQRQVRFVVRAYRVHGPEGLGELLDDPRVRAILPWIERISARTEDVERFTNQAEILTNRYDVLSERFPYNAVVRLKSAATVLFRR